MAGRNAIESVRRGLNPTTEGKSAEYERSVGTEVSASDIGASQTFGRAAEVAGQGFEYASKVAAQISSEQAAAAGQKLANEQPGVEPLPAFTTSDRAYVDAYRQEEKNNLLFQGQQFFDTAGQMVAKNPTPGNLLKYEQSAQQTIKGLLANVTEHNRPDVQRILEGNYTSHHIQLTNAVEAENKRILKENSTAAHNQGLENTYTQGSLRQWDSLTGTVQDLRLNNQHALAQKSITAEEYRSRNEDINIQEGVATHIADLMDAERAGKGDAYLALFADSKSHYSPQEKDAIGQTLLKQVHSYRALKSGQQQIDYTHAMMEVEAQAVTASSFEKWRGTLSGEQYANVERAYAKQQAKVVEGQQLLQAMTKDFGNVAKMRENWSEGQVSDVFLQLVNQQEAAYQQKNGQPQPNPLIAQASIAQQIKRENPVITKTLSDVIGYGSPQEATEAAQAIRMLEGNNPIALKGMSPETKMVSELFNLHSMDRTKTAEEALKQAREDVYNVDESMRNDRIIKLNEYQRVNNSKDPSAKLKEIKGALSQKSFLWGHKDTVIPDGVITEFDKLWTNFAATGGNIETAKQMALNELGRIYTPTRINNRSEIMRMSPESVLSDEGNYIQNSKVLALNDIIKNNQAIVANKGFVMSELEWVNDPFAELDESKDSEIVRKNKAIERKLMGTKPKSEFNIIDDELVKGDTFIKYNGKVRKVFAESDAVTSLSGDGKPSWVFYVMDDFGNKEPIMSTDHKGGIARWSPDSERLLSTKQQKDKILLEQARHYRDLARTLDTEESITRMIQHGAGYY